MARTKSTPISALTARGGSPAGSTAVRAEASSADALRAELGPVVRRLEAARRRVRLTGLARSAVKGVALVAPAAAAAVVVGRLTGSTVPAVGCVVAGGLGVAAVRGGRTLIGLRTDRTTPADAAERLDLAAGDGNRIATALDLAETNDGSPFAAAALADGVARLRANRDLTPVLPAAAFAPGRWAWAAAAGLAACVAAGVWPVTAGSHAVGPAVAVAGPTGPDAPADGVTPDLPRPPSAGPSKADREATPDDGRGAPSGTTASARSRPGGPAGASAGTSAASVAAAAADDAAGAGDASGEAARGTPSASTGGHGAAAAARADSPAPADASPVGANPPADPKPADRAAREAAAKSSSSASAGASSGSPRAGQAGASAKPSGGDPQAGQNQQNGEGQRSKSAGQQSGGNRSGQNGQGQGDGQSPPKKSRGVPPALPGERLADSVTGPSLAGPDERKTVRPPTGVSSEASPAVRPLPAARPQESAATPYAVPSSDLSAVTAYFEHLHRTAAATAVAPN